MLKLQDEGAAAIPAWLPTGESPESLIGAKEPLSCCASRSSAAEGRPATCEPRTMFGPRLMADSDPGGNVRI
jgi:hypothetical protein